jgi:hypothetical protein
MEAGWLIHELAQRTRYRHFPPLVATCTNEDKGECSAILRTGELLARVLSTCCSGSGTTRARASAPASSTTTSTVTAPPVRLKVRSGAWNTGWHDGSGFTQRISSSTPQRTLTRLGRDQPGHRRRPPQCGRHRSPRPDVYLLLEQARLAGRDQLQLFLGRRLAAALPRRFRPGHRLLDQAVARIFT